jgi:hypothetical protein
MSSQFIVGFMEVAFDSRVLDRSVYSLGLTVIRYEIRRRLCARLFPKGVMVSPSGTRGAGSDQARSGRPTAIAIEEYHSVYPA